MECEDEVWGREGESLHGCGWWTRHCPRLTSQSRLDLPYPALPCPALPALTPGILHQGVPVPQLAAALSPLLDAQGGLAAGGLEGGWSVDICVGSVDIEGAAVLGL